ncbi:MAG TPA: hypothetical protein VNG31_07385 [Candidatus Baltobacteraceae bacterium]|nr:hypothetical protein [Candidatus Baltobacteraceae bacterium]
MTYALLLAVTVRLLALPPHATIDPFGPRALMAASTGQNVAATVTIDGFLHGIAVWRAGRRVAMPHVPGSAAIAAFEADGRLLVNGDRPVRLTRASSRPIDLRSCENFPQSSVGPVVAGVLSDGSVIATMRSPPTVDLDDTSGQYAPVVLHLRSNQCLNMGNGIALGTDGLYTAGYAAYISGVPAPSNVVSAKERFVAMRWHDRTPQPLGNGVAIAVNASGMAVGSDVPPGEGFAFNATPHARVWNAGSTAALELAATAPLSVAYAVDERGRVTGMLEDRQRRHYAFLWSGGRLRRLDDVVRAPGWRFECGYTFSPGGALIGIGTYRGTPAAFEIDGLSP